MAPKVMVGVVTYLGQKYCLEQFVESLSRLTHPDLEFVFVINSGSAYKEIVEKTTEKLENVTILVDETRSEWAFEVVASSRNMMRDHFLASKAEWLHIMDSDVLGPKNRIEVFLKDNKKLLTGWYLSTFKDSKGKGHVLPVVYGYRKGVFARQIVVKEMLEPKLLKVVMAGLGLVFAHRSVMEHVAFRFDSNKKKTDDTLFFLDAKEQGYQLYLDTRVAGWHLRFPDKRSKLLDPRRYLAKGQ
ncbi:glycosyltransferase family 2 protein [Candidatus Woesearchaeota archaeon]|nr:glycosyltransferase family 2 protein [Candidatus Woesearchaeota archaeon]